MKDYEIDEQIAQLLRESRNSAGISQESIANALGVSRKSVQNWESGASAPNIKTLIKWFDFLDIPIYPYLFRVSNPEFERINANSTDQDIKNALLKSIQDMDMSQIRKQFFEMFGEHGTAPAGMGEVKTAYLHLPMYVKIGIAEIICTQFEIAQARGELVKPDHIMPDVDALKSYIEMAKKAVIEGKDTYLIK